MLQIPVLTPAVETRHVMGVARLVALAKGDFIGRSDFLEIAFIVGPLRLLRPSTTIIGLLISNMPESNLVIRKT